MRVSSATPSRNRSTSSSRPSAPPSTVFVRSQGLLQTDIVERAEAFVRGGVECHEFVEGERSRAHAAQGRTHIEHGAVAEGGHIGGDGGRIQQVEHRTQRGGPAQERLEQQGHPWPERAERGLAAQCLHRLLTPLGAIGHVEHQVVLAAGHLQPQFDPLHQLGHAHARHQRGEGVEEPLHRVPRTASDFRPEDHQHGQILLVQPMGRLTHRFKKTPRRPPFAGCEFHAARVPRAQKTHVPPAENRRRVVHERGRQIDVPSQLVCPSIDLPELVDAHPAGERAPHAHVGCRQPSGAARETPQRLMHGVPQFGVRGQQRQAFGKPDEKAPLVAQPLCRHVPRDLRPQSGVDRLQCGQSSGQVRGDLAHGSKTASISSRRVSSMSGSSVSGMVIDTSAARRAGTPSAMSRAA